MSMRSLSARERYARNKARARGVQLRVERVNLKQVLRDANGICGICKLPLGDNVREIDFDHIVPLALGGIHTHDNIQATHVSCNRSKGAK